MENKRILAVGQVYRDHVAFFLSASQDEEKIREYMDLPPEYNLFTGMDDSAFIESELQDLMDFMEDVEFWRRGC